MTQYAAPPAGGAALHSGYCLSGRTIYALIEHLAALVGGWLRNKAHDNPCEDRAKYEAADVREEGHTAAVICRRAQRSKAVDELQHEPEAQYDESWHLLHSADAPQSDDATHLYAGEHHEVRA